jgi:hypothetical protein
MGKWCILLQIETAVKFFLPSDHCLDDFHYPFFEGHTKSGKSKILLEDLARQFVRISFLVELMPFEELIFSILMSAVE